MTYLGVDSAASISASAAKILRENGISFVGRYLVPPGMHKDLKAEEIKAIHDAGLAILLCWEIGAEDVKGGAERGSKDGGRAKALAEGFGVPAGTTIFFACDYCPVQGDYPAIEAYLRAAQAACRPYVAGLYGPAKIVDYIAERGACGKFWQCIAWSEGKISQHMNVYQYQWSGGAVSKAMQAKIGVPVDMNRSEDLKAAGLWMPKTPTPEPAWYDSAMAWAEKFGLIKDGRPNDPVTRAELATMLMRYDTIIDAKILEAMNLLQPDDSSLGGLISD